MIRRILVAYQVEIVKALRLKSTYLGLGLVAVAVLCAPLLHPLRQDGDSDYEFIAIVTTATLNLLGLILMLAYSAGLVATESAAGTVRLVLVRPIRRSEFLAAKLLTGMTYALSMAVLVAVLSWGLVLAFGDAQGVSFGGELLYTGGEVFYTYILGFLLQLVPLFAAVAYAVMMSTLTRSPAVAITASIGVWLLLDSVKYPLGIDQYLFTSYLETPWQPFLSQVTGGLPTEWFPSAGYCLATSLGYGLVFVLAAVVAFRRRSLYS